MPRRRASVRARPYRLRVCGLTAHSARSRLIGTAPLLVRQHADRRLRILLDLRLALRRAAPAGEHEAAGTFNDLAQLRVIGDATIRILFAPLDGSSEQSLLEALEPVGDRRECICLVQDLLALH